MNFSDNITFTIGIASDTSFLQYCSETGEIKDDKGVLGKMEPIEQNIVVNCQFRRVEFCGRKIQLLSFIRNNELIGAWVIKGTNLRPQISFNPKGEDIGCLEIKTNLGSCKDHCRIGMVVITMLFMLVHQSF